MAKNPGKIRVAVEYAGMGVGYFLLARLPLRLSKAIAFLLADVWRLLDRKHRLLALAQSMDRLGIDAPGARRLVRDNYRHYALFAMETARLRTMPLAEVERRTGLNGGDAIMRELLSHGKGLVVLTGHLGNWEWGAVVIGMLKTVEGMIARPLDNPRIDAFLRSIRERTGVSVWDKAGSMRKAFAAQRKGGGFVAVIDQDGGRKGHWAPFLGKDGSTMSTPIELAIRTGAPLFVGAMVRVGDVRFDLVPKGVYWPDPAEDAEREKKRLIAAVNADLSEIIRAYPEQWIWIHRRWKSMPAG